MLSRLQHVSRGRSTPRRRRCSAVSGRTGVTSPQELRERRLAMLGAKSKRLMRGVLGSMFCTIVGAGVGFQASPAAAASVRPLFDLSHPTGSPFPSDRFTVPDSGQNTGL